jgi:hypothetical protein
MTAIYRRADKGRGMKRGHQRVKRTDVPQGTWLAFLALAVQVLLPFFVAYEIGLASTPAYAEGTTVICSASGSTTAPTPRSANHASHHTLSDGCPICIALAASHAFTTALPVALPLPQASSVILRHAADAPRTFASTAAFYNPRAPPSIA